MKVALILTGHLRCWEQVFPHFKQQVLDRWKPDVYIHTWSNEGYWLMEEDARGILHENSPPIDIHQVNDTYHPRRLVVEDLDQFLPMFGERAKTFTNYYHRPRNTISMYYKMGVGMQLLQRNIMMTGTKYDLVIRMRPDMIFHEPLPDFRPDKFYTIAHKNAELNSGTGDMLQAGSFENVSKFCDVGLHLESIYQKVGRFCPHIVSQHYIEHLNLPWIEFNINKTITHSPAGSYQQARGHTFKEGYIAPGGILKKA